MQVQAVGCLVTGASRGIGRATALELARRGCRVALIARDRAGLDQVAGEVEEAGGSGRAFPADVADSTAVTRAVDDAAAWCGELRVAVVNAGVGAYRSVQASTDNEARRVMEVNYFGACATVRAAVPHVLHAAPATIVAVSSLFAAIPVRGGASYGASKAALELFLACLRLELAGTGVSVGWVTAGAVDTDMIATAIPIDKLPRLARVLVPTMAAEKVARTIVRCAESGRRRKVIPPTAACFVAFERFFPRLAERTKLLTGAGDV